MFGRPPLRHPLSKCRAAASRELLDGDRTELPSTLNLAVPRVGVLLEGEHPRSVGVVLAPADLPSACTVLACPRPDAHFVPLPFRRLTVASVRLRVLATPRRSSSWARAGATGAPRPRATRRMRCCAAPSSASRMPSLGVSVGASLTSVLARLALGRTLLRAICARQTPGSRRLATGSRRCPRCESRPQPRCGDATAAGRGLGALVREGCAGARVSARRDQTANGGRPAVPPQLGRQQPPA